jgi:penicillin-binding protein 1C
MWLFSLALLLSYLLGSVSGSLLLGRLRGVDIRTQGSGNAGATNALRTQGKTFAAATVLIDLGKGAFAALVIAKLATTNTANHAPYACALSAVIGHCFPIFFGFRGGKGAGTAFGAMLALIPLTALLAIAAWLLCLVLTGYVGLSTVVAALLALLGIVAITPIAMPGFAYAAAMLLLVVCMHHSNLARMLKGTENRFEKARLLRRWRRLLLISLSLALALIVYRHLPHPKLYAGLPLSRAVLSEQGVLMQLTLASDDRYRLWQPLASFAPTLVQATLLKEDRWFYYHPGVNPYRLVLAAFSSYGGGRTQGASTLTMQLARLKYGLRTRTIWGKVRQIGYALRLEAGYSKHDLLEAYLNLAPYGGNIEGAAAASLIYFDKPAANLSLPEALTLAVLPQRPAHRGPKQGDQSKNAAAELSTELNEARNALYLLWQQNTGRETAGTAQTTLFQAPLSIGHFHNLSAPHAARLAVQISRLHTANEPIDRVQSTIDLSLQRIVERQLQSYLRTQRAHGIQNAAILLVDRDDMAVRALVGSADFNNAAILGQVDGTQAQRSPGSTLKPLIYALAMDQGLLHPKSVLADVATSFSSFAPENFDGRFRGPISVTEALVRSRNVPAVRVAAKLSNGGLYRLLRDANVRNLASEAHYGLALALGGGEISPAELAGLYAMIANDGRFRPLRYLQNDPKSAGHALISAEAAFITRQMLYTNPRPNAANRADNFPVAWKTGTSWGFRDAWSAGMLGQYVLVVWVGNFDGAGNPALVGGLAAAPLFFGIANDLYASQRLNLHPDLPADLNVIELDVCAASGDLPNAECPVRSKTWFIPGVSPIRVSDVHRKVFIDAQTGAPVCRQTPNPESVDAQKPSPLRTEVREFWSSEIAQSFIAAGLQLKTAPNCSTVQAPAPTITAPLNNVSYRLSPAELKKPSLVLRASAGAGVSQLYWFANGSFVGTSKPGVGLRYTPKVAHEILVSVVDDLGGRAERRVRVAVR